MGKLAPNIRENFMIMDCSDIDTPAMSTATDAQDIGLQDQVHRCYIHEAITKDYFSKRLLITANVGLATKTVAWFGWGWPILGGPGDGHYLYHFDMSITDPASDKLVAMGSFGMAKSGTGWRKYIPMHIITGGYDLYGGHYKGSFVVEEPTEHTVSSDEFDHLVFSVGLFNKDSAAENINNCSIHITASRFTSLHELYDPRG